MNRMKQASRSGTALLLACVAALTSCGIGGPLPFDWPPAAGETYPDVELMDHRGELVKLSSFKGKVLLIEPIGMT